MHSRLAFRFLLSLVLFPSVARADDPKGPPKKPNILLILADDLGFSDLGCYGSEIKTPVLDGLAKNGVRFRQFYNCTRCCPSRAALLTGLYPHQAGVGDMDADGKASGYRGFLQPRCVTIAQLLKQVGYRTYMVGKWHLTQKSGPIARGFDEFYGMIGGFNSYFQEKPFYTRLPKGRPVRTYPADKFYSTDVFADYALEFLEGARKHAKEPWFLYLAFNAPHFPLHAPAEEIAKYAKLYEKGWDQLRAERHERMKQLGVIGRDVKLTPRSEYYHPFKKVGGINPPWDALDADRHADLARRMAIYAAMVDRMDQAIGRVVENLKKNHELEQTLIFFLSDNGGSAEWDPFGFDVRSGPMNILHRGADLDKMGGPSTYHSAGSGWAGLMNTPWRLYKHYANEGGVSTPLIVHWPAGMSRKNDFENQAGHLMDLMPTCLEVAGAKYPGKFDDHDLLPLEGRSLLPALHKGKPEPRTFFWEHHGNKAVLDGKWKLVAKERATWELYDFDTDRTEMNNLLERHPEVARRMSQMWDEWARRCYVAKTP